MDIAISFPMLGDWTINPSRTYSIFGLTLSWYGAIIAFGFVLAVIYIIRRSPQFGIKGDDILDMILWIVPSAIIVSRIYYVVFYFDLYRDNLLDMFKIWEGGLAIYGVIIGGVAGLILFCRRRRLPVLPMLDLAAMGLPIGQAIGRWANFINREAYGRATDIFCRMGLTYTSTGSTIYVHPTFLYESLWNFVGFLGLHFYTKKYGRRYDGQVFLMYICWYGMGRAWIEGLRTDSLMLFATGIRVSQLVALVTAVAAAVILLIIEKRHTYSPEKLYVNILAAQKSPEDASEPPSERPDDMD